MNIIISPLILIPIALTLSIYSALANAEPTTNEGLYQVEMIIFKRGENYTYADDERWRRDTTLRYPQNYRQLITTETTGRPAPASVLSDPSYFYTLPQSEYTLDNLTYALRKDRSYQVLFHQAWQQKITEKETPAVIIQGGDKMGQYHELAGSIQLRVSRYLHIETDLWLTRFSSANNPDNVLNNGVLSESIADNSWPTLPLPPTASGQSVTATNTTSSTQYNLPAVEYIATFREKRRMRSEELHYIDHPALGLLMMITPVEEKPNSK